MHRFFVEEPAMGEDSITITGGDVNHIKNVLRMSVGDKICVINGQNNKEYYCEITAVGNWNSWSSLLPYLYQILCRCDHLHQMGFPES